MLTGCSKPWANWNGHCYYQSHFSLPNLSSYPPPSTSSFWKSIISCCREIRICSVIEVGNNKRTTFWTDPWMCEVALSSMIPNLYNLASSKDISINQVISKGYYCLHFNCVIIRENLRYFCFILHATSSKILKQEDDNFTWGLNGGKRFSVKSLYTFLNFFGICSNLLDIWNAHSPPKYKIHVWLILPKKLNTAAISFQVVRFC